ncbi:MAG: TAXI family TRAP transporter solute-binding subunit [Rhodospirillum sp.]|nr:TAXI family TRAP transporter solute-binding subunit [Rhodospirillum sp.]MCF8490557.1 TAXI family TRAP transporter solute-binding subunit [Rhodospirillum sp.]MCF8500603.1 TAXI family TRAP transporter solute-binding subunit [Rhodospirillum sp.]
MRKIRFTTSRRSASLATTFAVVGVATLSIVSIPSDVRADDGLPSTMIWTAYDLGSSGYAEASGIADALQKKNDLRVRIVPSGTSIGRLLPLTTGKARYGFLANEVSFASEGLYEFADQSWGPQDLRVILGKVETNGLAAAADAGIKTMADLKGKRVGYVEANPSVNVKTDAQLAFAGLTRDDVEPVFFGSYAALVPAMEAGQIDARNASTTSAAVRQMESSARGLYWVPMPADDKDGWAKTQKIASFLSPAQAKLGAGLSEENPVWMLGYRYPMITTYADTSEGEVYAMVKALDEAYDGYKNTTPTSSGWTLSEALRTPADAPFHPGAVRYAKEKGIWTDEDEAWNNARLARMEKVQTSWTEALDAFTQDRVAKSASGEKMSADQWPAYWDAYRAEHLAD